MAAQVERIVRALPSAFACSASPIVAATAWFASGAGNDPLGARKLDAGCERIQLLHGHRFRKPQSTQRTNGAMP